MSLVCAGWAQAHVAEKLYAIIEEHIKSEDDSSFVEQLLQSDHSFCEIIAIINQRFSLSFPDNEISHDDWLMLKQSLSDLCQKKLDYFRNEQPDEGLYIHYLFSFDPVRQAALRRWK